MSKNFSAFHNLGIILDLSTLSSHNFLTKLIPIWDSNAEKPNQKKNVKNKIIAFWTLAIVRTPQDDISVYKWRCSSVDMCIYNVGMVRFKRIRIKTWVRSSSLRSCLLVPPLIPQKAGKYHKSFRIFPRCPLSFCIFPNAPAQSWKEKNGVILQLLHTILRHNRFRLAIQMTLSSNICDVRDHTVGYSGNNPVGTLDGPNC